MKFFSGRRPRREHPVRCVIFVFLKFIDYLKICLTSPRRGHPIRCVIFVFLEFIDYLKICLTIFNDSSRILLKMNFISLDFLKFMLLVFSIYFFIPHKFKWLFLLAASYFFYGFYRLEYLPLLILPTAVVYFIAIKIDSGAKQPKKKILLIAGLVFALAALFVFKYTNFVGGAVFSLIGLFNENIKFTPFELIFALGISFYSFKLVSYLVDVYNEKLKAETHAGYFALYVSFFPQLFMGPIDRAVHFLPELKKKVTFDGSRVISGLQLITWGVFKKIVISDRVAIFVNQVFAAPEDQGLNLILAAYFYAFLIYCDFSAASDIAIGISRILGFKAMRNFDFPYFSKSITQFWNKWHISLSTWLRDYLFLPICYATMRRIKAPRRLWGIKVEAWGYMVGMFITMFLGGLWHGASWTFVVWGMLHGVYLIFSYAGKKTRKKWAKKTGLNRLPRFRRLLNIFVTFNLVSFAWIFFRAESFAKAFTYIQNIQLKPSGKLTVYMFFSLIIVVVFILLESIYKNKEKIRFLQKMPLPVRIAGFAFFICLIVIFSLDVSNEFIYLQF